MSKKKTSSKSIFVSSTFRDMQAERDALRDYALPKVNEFAARYGRAVELIDLRWGVDTASVTDEEQNHKVLRTCLDEIVRSRPFFIGLLGDRYGWIPPRANMADALESVQFSLNDLDKSVTALEIEYGALRAETPPVCLFYFRESPDYGELQEEIRRVYLDGKAELERLDALKDEIRTRFGSDVKNYSAAVTKVGLAVSREWAHMVADDIIAKLRDEWGVEAAPSLDWRRREQDIQEAFRESRTLHFTGRSEEIEHLLKFCLGEDTEESGLLMIQGEAGSGKSGLLCKVMDEIESDCFLLPFCCGLSPHSSRITDMLRLFIHMLSGYLGIEDVGEGITKFKDLKDCFFELLCSVCEKTRVVAVVDALDQLDGGDEARHMLWISGRLPENFRLLCSIIDGPETAAIRQWGGQTRPVPPIGEKDIAEIIRAIAMRQHKQIGDETIKAILQKQTTGGAQAAQNPLYLSLIVQDLVMMDRYEHAEVDKYMAKGLTQPQALLEFMSRRIDDTPGDAEGAYLSVLERLERLTGRDFIRAIMGMIALSRNGLREGDIFSAFEALGLSYNAADFSWLRQILRGHFAQGDMQQWDFSHQSLRRALQKRDPEEQNRLNDGISTGLCSAGKLDEFTAREIMHHLCMADQPAKAAKIIAEYAEIYESALTRGLADVYSEHTKGSSFLLAIPAHAETVEKGDRHRIAESLRKCLTLLPEDDCTFHIALINAALDSLPPTDTLSGIDLFMTCREAAICDETLGDLYIENDDYEKAGKYYEKAIKANEIWYEQAGTSDAQRAISVVLIKLGDYFTQQGRALEAGGYYQNALGIREKIASYQHSLGAPQRDLMISMLKMGDHLMASEKIDEAGLYYGKALNIAKKLCEQGHTAAALIDLAVALNRTGNYRAALGKIKEAAEYYMGSLNIREKLYELSGSPAAWRELWVSLIIVGDHLMKYGEKEAPGEYLVRALDMAEEMYEQKETVRAYNDLSEIYDRIGNFLMRIGENAEALEYFGKSVDIHLKWVKEDVSEARWKKLMLSLTKLAQYLMEAEYPEEAEAYLKSALNVAENIYKKSRAAQALYDVSVSLILMGECLIALDKENEADAYFKKACAISEELCKQDKTDRALRHLMYSYKKMAECLTEQFEMEAAGEYITKALQINEALYNQDKMADSLWEVILSLYDLGDNRQALGLKAEARALRKKMLALFKECVKRDPSKKRYESYFKRNV